MYPAPRLLGATLAAALCLGPLQAWAQTPAHADVRSELEAFGEALERAVRKVSHPVGLMALSGSAARGYHLPGVGAVFVLPPRALPARRTLRLADRQAARSLAAAQANLEESLRRVRAPELRAQIERTLQAVRQAQAELRRPSAGPEALLPPVALEGVEPPPLPEVERHVQQALAEQARALREMERERDRFDREVRRQVEEQMRVMQEQAEAFRRQAERAQREADRELRRRLREPLPEPAPAPEPAAPPDAPAAPASPVSPAVPAPAAPPAAAPPAPPWHFWSQGEEVGEPEEPETVMANVRGAVLAVLESEGGRLRRLGPEESVVVALDFVPRLLGAGARSGQRTLVLKVRQRDIAARQAGRIGAEEFRRRVEAAEY